MGSWLRISPCAFILLMAGGPFPGCPLDADRDGYPRPFDCNDADPGIHPGAEEVCGDGVDNNCDGQIDGCGLYGVVDISSLARKFVGEAPRDGAGFAVAGTGDIDGDGYDDVLTGAPYQDTAGEEAGAAYLEDGPEAGMPGTESLSQADARFDGESINGQTGQSVSGAGDVNGDGYDDVLIGAPYEDTDAPDAGAAYVVFGPVSGAVDLADADVRIGGAGEGFSLGLAVASGDVNGDGYSDVVVGDYGAAYLFYGPLSGALGIADADASLTTPTAGIAVATGDLDADGNDDVLITAPFGGDIRGVTYLLYGPVYGPVDPADADAQIEGEQPNDAAGTSVASGGDANGDGVEDLLIGSVRESSGGFEAGATYLLYGPVSGTISLANADAKFQGETSSTTSSNGIAFADLNGDGYDDIVIGAPFGDAVYVVYGPPPAGTSSLANADAKLIGPTGQFGWSVANAGDVNADGLEDLVIGAPGDTTLGPQTGAAYVLLSPSAQQVRTGLE